ncbi:hypothetical protein RDI58_000711 [Solanum bulbocastanum]|uniref:Uncharacterized protein n=1 Tax=Solanum bulbocastanum TaxID=147425 RepID=A0AAN8U1R9_SOLBU
MLSCIVESPYLALKALEVYQNNIVSTSLFASF